MMYNFCIMEVYRMAPELERISIYFPKLTRR
jgi:hypothetical protein